MKHGAEIEAATFSDDGDLVATGGRDGKVRLWDGREGIPLSLPLEVGGWVKDIQFTAPREDGTRLLVASTSEGTARV
jgi:WD40 repeat protein